MTLFLLAILIIVLVGVFIAINYDEIFLNSHSRVQRPIFSNISPVSVKKQSITRNIKKQPKNIPVIKDKVLQSPVPKIALFRNQIDEVEASRSKSRFSDSCLSLMENDTEITKIFKIHTNKLNNKNNLIYKSLALTYDPMINSYTPIPDLEIFSCNETNKITLSIHGFSDGTPLKMIADTKLPEESGIFGIIITEKLEYVLVNVIPIRNEENGLKTTYISIFEDLNSPLVLPLGQEYYLFTHYDITKINKAAVGSDYYCR